MEDMPNNRPIFIRDFKFFENLKKIVKVKLISLSEENYLTLKFICHYSL
jgi:hypothetical protein